MITLKKSKFRGCLNSWLMWLVLIQTNCIQLASLATSVLTFQKILKPQNSGKICLRPRVFHRALLTLVAKRTVISVGLNLASEFFITTAVKTGGTAAKLALTQRRSVTRVVRTVKCSLILVRSMTPSGVQTVTQTVTVVGL